MSKKYFIHEQGFFVKKYSERKFKTDERKSVLFTYNNHSSVINIELLASNKKLRNLKKVLDLFRKKFDIFDKAEQTDDREELKKLAEDLENLEFEMQDAWGFPRDRNKHSYWYKIPKCSCAKLDNQDFWGTNLRSISADCPIHGSKNE